MEWSWPPSISQSYPCGNGLYQPGHASGAAGAASAAEFGPWLTGKKSPRKIAATAKMSSRIAARRPGPHLDPLGTCWNSSDQRLWCWAHLPSSIPGIKWFKPWMHDFRAEAATSSPVGGASVCQWSPVENDASTKILHQGVFHVRQVALQLKTDV